MIQITPSISIDEKEIEENFIRAPGPGGQKVNKTESAVQLRFDAANSPALSWSTASGRTRVEISSDAASSLIKQSNEGVFSYIRQRTGGVNRDLKLGMSGRRNPN